MREIEEVLGGEGPPQELAGNVPLSLDENEGGWLVVSGQVDVFAVPLVDGKATGARSHLLRAGVGEMVCGTRRMLADEPVALIAVGGPETRILHASPARLVELARDPELSGTTLALWDGWARGLIAGLSPGPAPKPLRILTAGQPAVLEDVTNVVPASGLVWVIHDQGTSRFLGREELPLGPGDGLTPLVDPGWMAAQPGARLSTCTTADVAGGPGAWTALERFHQLVARCAEQNRRKAMSLERERLHLKAESEKRLLRSTLSRLAAVVEPERDGAAIPEVEEPPLVTACRLVGGQLGMLIQDPGRLAGKGRGSDPVAAVARASHLRTRRVLLSGPWWRRDNGPLLGFRSADEHPVALLPVSPSGYELIDPVAQTRDPVTAAVASEVRSFGYTFYRPFPPRALTLWDVMRLGFSGGVRDVLTVVLVGTVGGLLGMLPPIVMGWIFDTITPGLARSELIPILFALGFGAMAAAFLRLVQGVAILRVQTRAEGAVEAGLWDRLLNLPASFFRVYSSGDLATRAMGISAIRQVLTEVAWTTLVSLVFSLVSFGLLIVYDARLAVLTATLVTALFAVTILTMLRQLRYERGLHDQRGRIAGLVLQMVSGISRLRVAAAESRALALWAGEFSKQRRFAIRSHRLADNLSAFDAAASVLATLVLYATVARAEGGGLSLGKFLAFNAAFAQILAAVAMISANAGLILQVVPLYERAGPILRGLPEIDPGRADPGELSGEIEINHVSFRYQPDGPLVLDDVCAQIRPGQFVAFVGPSGAGKSTLLRLLLGFEVPAAGSIYFNRQDLSVLDLQAVRRQIGVVLQNGKLTPGDILSNIIGTSTLTLDDAWEAARLSGIDEEIAQMPMGMFTVLGDGESTLSGGQRQRLMIARAIAPRPHILLFDEATSALDNVTQDRVRQSLAEIKATRLVVAHRLSTIEHADMIYVMEAGRIVQRGSYADLVQQPGLFAELVKRQIA